MSTITITLPDDMKAYVEQQSAQRGFQSLSDYFSEMIRTSQKIHGLTWNEIQEMLPGPEWEAHLKKPEVAKDLEEKLLEGWNSPSIIADDAFWEDQFRKLREKHPDIDFDAEAP